MKNLTKIASIISLAFSLFAASAFASETPLAKKKFVKDVSGGTTAAILLLYKSEAAKKGSALNLKIEEIKKENDMPESGGLRAPEKKDLWMVSSGKASCCSYQHTYLLGIPAHRKGTGMIEDYAAYLVVNVYIKVEESEGYEITIEKETKINF